jgi:WD40 repeat protein
MKTLLSLVIPTLFLVGRGLPGPQSVPTTPNYRPLYVIEREPFVVQFQPEYFAFSPDGSLIAATATETTVNVWDIDTGKVIYEWEHERDWTAVSVSWSPDGTLISTGGNGVLRMWDATTGLLRYAIGETGNEYSGTYVGWSPDSTRFVTNLTDIRDAQTGELLLDVNFNWAPVDEAHWSPDGTLIASATGWEGIETHVWTVYGEHVNVFWTNHSISWSPDSMRVASFGQVRNVYTGNPVTIIPDMYGEIRWHPTEEWIASAYGDMVYLWDARNGEQLAAWKMLDCNIRGLAWSANGDRFAVSCLGDMFQRDFRNELIIWDRVR